MIPLCSRAIKRVVFLFVYGVDRLRDGRRCGWVYILPGAVSQRHNHMQTFCHFLVYISNHQKINIICPLRFGSGTAIPHDYQTIFVGAVGEHPVNTNTLHTMPRFLSALTPPFLLLFSAPLAALALLTTLVAFSTLFVRVLIVYIELALVVAHNQLFHHNHSSYSQPPVKGSSPPPTIAQQRRKKRRSSASSARSEQGKTTPKALETTTFGLITTAGIDRDFEGVGGWRFSGQDGDHTQWISSNTRLRLPAATREIKGKHNRLLTS